MRLGEWPGKWALLTSVRQGLCPLSAGTDRSLRNLGISGKGSAMSAGFDLDQPGGGQTRVCATRWWASRRARAFSVRVELTDPPVVNTEDPAT